MSFCISELINPRAPSRVLEFLLLQTVPYLTWTVAKLNLTQTVAKLNLTQTVAKLDLTQTVTKLCFTVSHAALRPPEMNDENLAPGAERLTRHFRAMPGK